MIARILVGLLLAIAVITCATTMLRDGLARRDATQIQSTYALAFNPGDVRALELTAGAELEAGRAQSAIVLAQRAIRNSPIAVGPVRVLGLATIRNGNVEAGERLMLAASQLGWRDPPTQVWAAEQALRSGQLHIAIARAEALIRTEGVRHPMFAVLRTLAPSPEGRQAIIDRLQDNPPWRQLFFNPDAAIPPDQLEGNRQLLLALMSTSAHPTPMEARATIAGLIGDRRSREAWALYRSLFGPLTNSLVTDGGFSRLDTDYRPGGSVTMFDWTMYEQPAGQTTIDRSDSFAKNPAMRAEATNTGANIIAEQVRVLPPGTYRLSWRGLGEAGEGPSAVAMQVICVDDASRLAEAAISVSEKSWTRNAIVFAVPASCTAQRLAVVTASQNDSDPQIVWIDDVELTPLANPAPRHAVAEKQ